MSEERKEGYTRKEIVEKYSISLSRIKKYDKEGVLKRMPEKGERGAILYYPESVEKVPEVEEVKKKKREKSEEVPEAEVTIKVEAEEASGKYELEETRHKGVFLLREPDSKKKEVSPELIDRLLEISKEGNKTSSKIKALRRKEKSLKAEMESIAKEHEGLRGTLSVPDNAKVRTSPTVKKVYNRSPLQDDLGPLYYAYMDEGLMVELTIFGAVSPEAIIKGTMDLLLEQGISEERIPACMEIKRPVKPKDEKKFQKQVEKGRLSLSKEAVTEDESWQTSFSTLD